MGIRRARSLIAAGALVLALAGCSVDTTLTVRVRPDGSGVVRVDVRADGEAVAAVEQGGVPIDEAVRLADLEEVGWDVGRWVRADDGSATLELEQSFAHVDEVERIARELNGDLGPLPRLRASRAYGLLSTDYTVRGRIDLAAAGSGVASDADLSAALAALGVDVDVIDEQLRAQVQSSFGLEVVVRLPGAPARAFAPDDGDTSAVVDASSSVRNTERLLFLVAAAGFLALAVVVWVRGGRRRRRRGRGTPRGRGPRPAGSAPRGGAAAPSARRPGPAAPPTAARPPARRARVSRPPEPPRRST